jgi:hypothetical protein
MVHRINGKVRKSRSVQFCADAFYIVVAMRGTGQETRGIMRKTAASDSVTVSANSFSEIRSHTLKRKRPPGLKTRHASR